MGSVLEPLVSNDCQKYAPSCTVKAFAVVLRETAARSAVNSCLGRCSFMFGAVVRVFGDGVCVRKAFFRGGDTRCPR